MRVWTNTRMPGIVFGRYFRNLGFELTSVDIRTITVRSQIDGVWQIEAGQAMGVRAAPSPGTYLLVYVQGEKVTVETYRGEAGPGFGYLLFEEVQLAP